MRAKLDELEAVGVRVAIAKDQVRLDVDGMNLG